MIFDLRSRSRRRTVQVVGVVILLMLIIGFIGAGVGTGGGSGGGILNAFTGNGSGNSQGSVVSSAQKQAEQQVEANPNSASAWGNLLQADWTAAGQGSNYNTSTDTFTASGKKQLAGVETAWTHYSALTSSPDPGLTLLAARADVAVGNYAGAAGAWEDETVAEPQAKSYECLAVTAYAAGQSRKGDLAAGKAVSLLPKAQQAETKTTLSEAKSSSSNAQQLAAQC